MHLGSAHGMARPARLAVAQPTWLVAQCNRNRGRRSATAALVAVGDFGKPAPEVGREQALWQGGSVVDRFEARKRSEGGSPKLSTATPVADGETEAEAWTGGRGGRRLGWGAARRCTRARGWVGLDGKRAEGVGTGEVLDGRPGGGKELGGMEVMEAKRRKVKSGEHPIYPRKAVEGGGGIGGWETAATKPWAQARQR
jgi:hypothetical protein